MGLDAAEHPGTLSNSADAHWPAVSLGARSSLEMGLDPKQLCQ